MTTVEPTGPVGPADTAAGPRSPAVPLAPPGHRAHLDGLRAVAVYLVVLFHVGAARFSGGFIGVDVFFVLSGYLVTQVLLRDVAGNGSIRFGRFYARRVRRLLPASILALLTTAALYAAVATPVQVSEAADGFRASFLYVANWYFVDQSTGYFADQADQSPVLHFWSLAVEEQFYLVWPLLLGALVWATARVGRHRWNVARIAIALGGLASAGWALHLRNSAPDRAYFGTDTRAYQLLAGALLALTPSVARRIARWPLLGRAGVVAGLVGLLVLGTDQVSAGPIWRGLAVTVVTVGLLVALEAADGGLARRALAAPPVVYLGAISYGTYLWHWPIIIVLQELVDLSTVLLGGIVLVVATGLASLSYQLVEQPVRRSPTLDRLRWPLVAAGLALSVLAALLVVPRLADPDTGGASDTAAVRGTEGFTPIPATFDQGEVWAQQFGETVDCVGRPAEACTVVTGTGPHLLLIGDSNAQMWIPAFTELARTEGLTLSLAVASGCPWQRGRYVLQPDIQERCRRSKEDAYDRVIPALDPDLVVATNALEIRGTDPTTFGADSGDAALREQTDRSAEELRAGGAELLIIEPIPRPLEEGFDPLECLAEESVVEACRFIDPSPPTWMEVHERRLDEASDDVHAADLDRLVCPFLPICEPFVDGLAVWWNREHLAARYSRSLAPELADYLRDRRILEP